MLSINDIINTYCPNVARWLLTDRSIMSSNIEGSSSSASSSITETTRENKTLIALAPMQSGKTKIKKDLVQLMYINEAYSIIPMIFTDNQTGRDIAEQLEHTFNEEKIYRVFNFSAHQSPKLIDVRAYIDGWISAKTNKLRDVPLMPLIIALKNPTQTKKILSVIKHTIHRNGMYAVLWDEADRTYKITDEHYVDGEMLSLEYFLKENTTNLWLNAAVTATDGDLLKLGKYDEWVDATLLQSTPSDEYRGILTATFSNSEALISQSSGKYVETVLQEKDTYFKTEYTTVNGEKKHRRIIALSDSLTEEHANFATKWSSAGYHCFTFNQYGIRLYVDGRLITSQKKKIGRVGDAVAKLITKYIINNDKPIIILGNRKVNRGLTFQTHIMSWTDMIIFGNNNISRDKLIQTAGRLCGNVGKIGDFPIDGITYHCQREMQKLLLHHDSILTNINSAEYKHETAGNARVKVEKRVREEEEEQEKVDKEKEEEIHNATYGIASMRRLVGSVFEHYETYKDVKERRDALFVECADMHFRQLDKKPPTKPNQEVRNFYGMDDEENTISYHDIIDRPIHKAQHVRTADDRCEYIIRVIPLCDKTYAIYYRDPLYAETSQQQPKKKKRRVTTTTTTTLLQLPSTEEEI